MNFSERVKFVKKEKGITNDALSTASGIPLGTLGKLLSGFTEEPKLSTAIALADALGCSLEYLALGKEDKVELNEVEESRLEKYRALDAHGARVCDFILDEEYLRCASLSRNVRAEIAEPIFRPKATEKKARMIKIPFFSDRVSAGLGVHLESNESSEISVALNDKTKRADFALRVSGNSMEPKYHDGDILLVENTPSVEVGQLGIFICDGEGYFKQFGGDCLISLNEGYAPIPLSSFENFSCRGSVIGTLRQKI
ncbi:MAG: helix-turn-helix domain-containing protein [Clostridia bacterium]|nr:helix-turn-helix domain-containing protein [Clostridia bacterium]